MSKHGIKLGQLKNLDTCTIVRSLNWTMQRDL